MTPMSPRTLRPRQTLHPEAASWAARVVANGGSVGTALPAVDRFCKAIVSAGIRSKFYRLNLFCGTGLNACLVPLYRGQSQSGTQFGNTVDTNVGPFVSGDYTATGGLTGGGSKHLDTGFATNILTAGDRHIAAYERVRSGGTFNTFLGSEAITGVAQAFSLGYGTATTVQYAFGAFGASLNATTTSAVGLWLGVNTPSNTGLIYRNGVQDSTGTTAAATPEASNIFVFALNRASVPGATNFYTGTLGGYSIGLAFTAAEAAAYYTAMQAFQTALSRNV